MPTTRPLPTCNGIGEGQLQPIAVNPATRPAAPASSSANHAPAYNPAPANVRPVQSPTPAGSRAAAQAAAAAPTVSAPSPAPAAGAFQVPPPPAPIKQGARKVIRSTHATVRTQEQQAGPSQSVAGHASAPRNNRFSYRQLREAWDSFAAARPKETILVNTFRACPPQPTSEETVFNVVLENPLQVEQLKSLMPQLMPHLCDAIGNDYLRLDLRINQSGPAPHIWNDTEILHHLLDTVPYLHTMMKELNLKLI